MWRGAGPTRPASLSTRCVEDPYILILNLLSRTYHNRVFKVSIFNLCLQEIPNELPYNDYFEYFGPDFKLHIAPSNMANQNTGEYVDKIRSRSVVQAKLDF